MSNTTTFLRRVIFITLLILLSGYSAIYSQIPRNIIITVPHSDQAVSVIYDASQGNKALLDYKGTIYAHTGILLDDGSWSNQNSLPGEPMTYIGDNKWRLDMPEGINSFYGTGNDIKAKRLAFVFSDYGMKLKGKTEDMKDIIADVSDLFEDESPSVSSEKLISCSTAFPTDQQSASFIFNTSMGNKGLKDYNGEIYAHTGITVNGKPWQYGTDWANPIEKHKLERIGDNQWKLNISEGIRSFFGVKAGESAERIWFVLRDKSGTKELKTEESGDIFFDLYDAGLHVIFEKPADNVTLKAGESFSYSIAASESALIRVFAGNKEINSSAGATILSGSYTPVGPGLCNITATATKGSESASETISINVVSETIKDKAPEGTAFGVNYYEKDPSKITLALNAPYKSSAYVIGDFNDWSYDTLYQMKRDGDKFWITIDGLSNDTEYAYQYVVDGSITIADPYANKVLDPINDIYINDDTYPGLKSYPEKASGIVSVLQTGKKRYDFNASDYKRPAAGNLIIYEMLIRDFTEEGTYKAAAGKIEYLRNLGINAIELMPVNEFEGNDSWGYNPSFFFAPDKAYGTEEDLKMFIDICHKNGIAVIIDMVLNHSFSQSPLVALYKAADGKPLNYSPWYNEVSNIQNSDLSWGFDFNHESVYTRRLVDDINTHWLKEYNIDGFRFDFTKGFSNTTYYTSSDKYANAYDAARINNLKRMKDVIETVSPGAYFICEHLTDFAEEKELADYGIMLWRNMSHSYQQAAMGWSEGSDFTYLYDRGCGMPDNSIVGYMESHDEERMAYKASKWGQAGVTGDKNISNRLRQSAACTSLFLTVPGPKLIWQFGELGYDISIDYNGRTGRKPVRWDYAENEDRYSLYTAYSKILALRRSYPELFDNRNNFNEDNGFTWNVKTDDWAKGRMLKSRSGSKTMVIAANLTCSNNSCSPGFTSSGTWYEYMTDAEINVSNPDMNVYMPAYSYRIYLNFRPEIVSVEDILSENTQQQTIIYGGQGKIFFSFDKEERVIIYDSCGRIVSEEVLSEGYHEKIFAKGIYFVNNRKIAVY